MKLDMVATVTYAAPRINGTPPVRPRFWYSETMYTGSLVSSWTRARTVAHTIYHLSSSGLCSILDEEPHPKPFLIRLLGEHSAPTALLPCCAVDSDLFSHLEKLFTSILEAVRVGNGTTMQSVDDCPGFFSSVSGKNCGGQKSSSFPKHCSHLRQRGDSGIQGAHSASARGGRMDKAIGNRHWKARLVE